MFGSKRGLILLLKRLKLVGEPNADALKTRLEKEYTPMDYILPVFFISMVVLFGMMLLFLSWMFYNEENTYSNVLLSGSSYWLNSGELMVEKRSIAVIAFAIMGSYINASQYIYRRFSTIDLTPGNFFSVGLRTILSALISLMLSFVFSTTELINTNIILVVAFLTGMFPDAGLRILLRKMRIFSSALNKSYGNYTLDQIEGVSEIHKIRLNEIGIDNVQNLAQFNFFSLIIKTPFPMGILLDWIAQAKLLVEFQEDFTKLRKAGIRTVFDFLDACDGNSQRFDQISAVCGINKLILEVNFQSIRDDPSVALLSKFRNNLENFKLD